MSLSTDFRFAARSLARRPLFSAVVILTLALAIGVNSAIFSIVNTALFSPLAVEAPRELVNIYTTDSTGRGYGGSSYPDYEFLRDNNPVFSGVFGYSGLMTTLTGGGKPEVVFGELVTGNYFAVSGGRIALGRGFTPDEDRTPGAVPVAVLSDGLWRRRFGADPAIMGRTITLNGHPFSVIGVAAPEFKGLLFRGIVADLWAPVMMMAQLRTDQLQNRGERWMFLKGRLKPGMTLAQARNALATLGGRLADAHPSTNRGRSFLAVPTSEVLVKPDGDPAIQGAAALLLATVGLVLIIACTNLANLMLVRAAARRREVAIRLALGATRLQIVRQLAAESFLLATVGGLAGLLLASWIAGLLVAFRPPIPVPISLDIKIDFRVVGFTALLSGAAAIVLGLLPAQRASRANVTEGLSGHGAVPARRSGLARLQGILLVPQLALSLVLLVVAGLFVRSIAKAGAVDPGFDIDHTALIALNLKLDGYSGPDAQAFYEKLTGRISALPGVTAATVTDRIPLDLYGNQTAEVSFGPSGPNEESLPVQTAHVDPGYFRALGVPLVRGRELSEDEVRRGAPVALVSEAAAHRFWSNGDPLGQRLRIAGTDGPALEVIGVVADTKVQTLGEAPEPLVYLPLAQDYTRLLRVVVQTEGDAAALLGTLRQAVRELDPDAAIFESKTMNEHLGVMLFPYRMAAALGSVLGGFGLLLACIGLYGVVGYSVTRRTKEFGIRMALGARTADVMRLVFANHFRAAAVGTVLGIGLSLGLARLMSGVLFGIGPADPLTLTSIPALFACIAAVAIYLPARRATRVNPSIALRED